MRLTSIDFLRGIALLGLPTMNIIVFAMPISAYLNPISFASNALLNDAIFSFFYVFADQKFMCMFSALFGASVLLLAEKNEANGKRAGRVHYIRTFWLIIIGFLHGWFLWEGDVLMIYGVVALVLYPFRKANIYFLGAASILFLSIAAFLTHHNDISEAEFGSELRADIQEIYLPNESQSKEREKLMLGAYTDTVSPFRQEFIEESNDEQSDSSGLARVGTSALIKILGMMCLGMLLFKLGILQGNKSLLFYKRLGLVGVSIGLIFTTWGLVYNYTTSWQIDAYFKYGMTLKEIGSSFMAVGYMSFLIFAYKKGYLDKVTNWINSVGQMALTNYLMQSLICAFIFYGYGAGLYGSVSRLELIPFIIGIWVFQVAFSVLWLSYFTQGPIEWIWRSLTYFRVQSIAKR